MLRGVEAVWRSVRETSVSAPLVPSHDHDVHLVLCDFGEHGTAYVETDPATADRNAVIRAFLAGEYERPISVIAFNLADGWVHDVSGSIARSIIKAGADMSLTAGTRAFIEMHFRQSVEPNPSR
jgi:hypothetical protein